MDRTAVTVRACLVKATLVWPGFRGWGPARPGVEAATEELGSAADPGVRFGARVASGNADSRAASTGCRALYKPDGRAPGGRFQPIAEHRGDQSVSARPRDGHDSAGRRPCFYTRQSPNREGREIAVRMLADGEMMLVARAVRVVSELRHAQERARGAAPALHGGVCPGGLAVAALWGLAACVRYADVMALGAYPGSAGLCGDGFPNRSERKPETVGRQRPEHASVDGPRGDHYGCCPV